MAQNPKDPDPAGRLDEGELRDLASGIHTKSQELERVGLQFADTLAVAQATALSRHRIRTALGVAAWGDSDAEEKAVAVELRSYDQHRQKLAINLERARVPTPVAGAQQFLLHGRVVHCRTGLGIEDAVVSVLDEAGCVLLEGRTESGGAFAFAFGPRSAGGKQPSPKKGKAGAAKIGTTEGGDQDPTHETEPSRGEPDRTAGPEDPDCAGLPGDPPWLPEVPPCYGVAVAVQGDVLFRDEQPRASVVGEAVYREVPVDPPGPVSVNEG